LETAVGTTPFKEKYLCQRVEYIYVQILKSKLSGYIFMINMVYWAVFTVSIIEVILISYIIPEITSFIWLFWVEFQALLVGVILVKSTGNVFNSTTRAILVGCGIVLLLCTNLHFLLGIIVGESVEESVRSVLDSYSFTSSVFCSDVQPPDSGSNVQPSDKSLGSAIKKGASEIRDAVDLVGTGATVTAVSGAIMAGASNPPKVVEAVIRMPIQGKVALGLGIFAASVHGYFKYFSGY
jgi:hypothetical protein